MLKTLNQSIAALASRRHQYFARKLGTNESWRAFAEFRRECVYLDIETDGGTSGDSVTVIGLFDGMEYTALVQGENLENFRDIISRYAMVVTFFGNGFDIPMLKKRFRDVHFDHIHIDLCPTLRRLGLSGGLKKIERTLGVGRDEGVDGMSGLDAVRLWRRHIRLGDTTALERLIAYNRADVVNLERLAEYAFENLCRLTRCQPT